MGYPYKNKKFNYSVLLLSITILVSATTHRLLGMRSGASPGDMILSVLQTIKDSSNIHTTRSNCESLSVRISVAMSLPAPRLRINPFLLIISEIEAVLNASPLEPTLVPHKEPLLRTIAIIRHTIDPTHFPDPEERPKPRADEPSTEKTPVTVLVHEEKPPTPPPPSMSGPQVPQPDTPKTDVREPVTKEPLARSEERHEPSTEATSSLPHHSTVMHGETPLAKVQALLIAARERAILLLKSLVTQQRPTESATVIVHTVEPEPRSGSSTPPPSSGEKKSEEGERPVPSVVREEPPPPPPAVDTPALITRLTTDEHYAQADAEKIARLMKAGVPEEAAKSKFTPQSAERSSVAPTHRPLRTERPAQPPPKSGGFLADISRLATGGRKTAEEMDKERQRKKEEDITAAARALEELDPLSPDFLTFPANVDTFAFFESLPSPHTLHLKPKIEGIQQCKDKPDESKRKAIRTIMERAAQYKKELSSQETAVIAQMRMQFFKRGFSQAPAGLIEDFGEEKPEADSGWDD
jgi:hypothetical protein